MKRYLIFSYPSCYPLGGWRDLHSESDNREEAITLAKSLEGGKGSNRTYSHVIDTINGDYIYGGCE